MTTTGTTTLRDELVTAGILVPTTSDGIYGRSPVYEDIVAALEGLVGGNHHFSLRLGSLDCNSCEPLRTIASARSFTRFNWCCQ